MFLKTAVILAAGMGTRLKEQGARVPKGFIRFGERPIIEESIECLRKSGVERIFIGTGHLKEFYDSLRDQYPGVVRTVHNPLFADSGSMYTLSMLHDRIEEDFLLLESDLIYEQRALEAVNIRGHANTILLSGLTHSGDEVYVEARDGLLINMSKDRRQLGPHIAGELVGISRISHPLFCQMIAFAQTRFSTTLKVDYETDCLVGLAAAASIHCSLVDDLLWAEIDDLAHLKRASEDIYPALRRSNERV